MDSINFQNIINKLFEHTPKMLFEYILLREQLFTKISNTSDLL